MIPNEAFFLCFMRVLFDVSDLEYLSIRSDIKAIARIMEAEFKYIQNPIHL